MAESLFDLHAQRELLSNWWREHFWKYVNTQLEMQTFYEKNEEMQQFA